MEQITLVLDNIRSAYNVGAILRSAAAFGIKNVVCAGITPYPKQHYERRLPHVAEKAHHAISKTALGAEKILTTSHIEDIDEFAKNYTNAIYALEQTDGSIPLQQFNPLPPMALVLGSEIDGVLEKTREWVTGYVEIYHAAHKESLNAATACGISLYDFYSKLEYGGNK